MWVSNGMNGPVQVSAAGARIDGQAEVALAFVGCVVPDEPRFHNAAFSRAGQMYQEELLRGLEQAGFPPTLIVSVVPLPSYPKIRQIWVGGDKTELAGHLPVRLVPFVNITPLKQITIGLSTLGELLRWGWRRRHSRFRVVCTYNLTVPPGLFTLLGARLIGAKAVVWLCDINLPGHTVPSGILWRMDYWLQQQLIPLFDGHIVAADAIARDFVPGRPYVRVEGGIRREVLDSTGGACRSKKRPGAPFVVVAAGRLDETNGFPALLEAFSLLEGNGYRLRIAGTGPLAEQIRQAAAKDPRVEYLGLLPFEEVLQLYDSADVLVNMRVTTTRNTRYFFPSKVMEYLASGTPVITTCTGHVEAEFGSFAYLLRKETPQELAERIRHLAGLDPEERRRVGDKARGYMAASKTWDAQARKVAHFIQETVLQMGTQREGQPKPGRVAV